MKSSPPHLSSDEPVSIGSSSILFHRLFEQDADGMIVCDAEGAIVEANPAACSLLGQGRENLLTRTLDTFFPDIGKPASHAPGPIAHSLPENTTGHTAVTIAITSLAEGATAYRLHPMDAPTSVAAVSHDESVLRAVIETMPDGILIVSASGRITHFNHRFLEIWSIPPDHPAVLRRDDAGLIELVSDQLIDPKGFTQRVAEIYRSDKRTEDFIKLQGGRVLERTSFPLSHANCTESERVWQFRDITLRKRKEEATAKRLEALTQPHVTADTIRFEDLFDIAEIQQIQDQFASAAGVASIITQVDGTPITRPSNFCRFCNDIVRQSPVGHRNCLYSDAVLGRHHPDGPIVQPCMSGGLWDAGASVTVDGRHIANWLIGQVRDGTQSEDQIRSYARTIGADEHELITAFREVPVMPHEEFERISRALFILANQLSKIAYQNLQQARHIAARKQAENALRAKTEELDRYFSNSLDLLCIAHSNGQFLRLNPTWEKVLGYPLSELEGRRFIDLVHPDDQAATLAASNALLGQSEVRSFVNRFRCKDGSYRWIEWNSRPEGDLVYAAARDITAHKQAEASLQANLRETQQLMQSMANAFVVWGLISDETGQCIDLVFEYFNDAYAKMADLTYADAKGKRVREVWPNTETEWFAIFSQASRTGSSVRFEMSHAPTHGIYAGTAYRSGDDPSRVCAVFEEITERKRAEEILRESEQRFRHMFEENRSVMLLIDPESGCIAEANPAAEEFYGYPHDQLCGMCIDRINMLPHEEVREKLRHVIEGRHDNFVFDHKLASGEIRTVEARASAVEIGGRQLVFSIIQDVTERERAQTALQASQTLLSESQRTAHIGSWEMDLTTQQVTWTDECYRINGVDPQTFSPTNESFFAMLRPEDREHLKTHLQQTLDTKSFAPFQCCIKRPDGNVRWLHVTGEVVCDSQGTPIKLFGSQQDVTEQKHAEERLHRTTQWLLHTQRISQVGGWIINPITKEVWISPEARQVYGIPENAEITLDYIRRFPLPEYRDMMDQAFRDLLQKRKPYDIEFKIKRDTDGAVVDIHSVAEFDEIEGAVLGVIHDITTRNQAEQNRLELERNLLHSQKLESLGVLAGGIAHDFNNLLMAIQANLDLARMDLPPNSPAEESIDQSILASRRAAELTQQMLNYSGKGNFAVQSLDLSGLVQENAHLFRACISRLINLEVDAIANPPPIMADAGQLQQVIMNLITNASEAIGDQAGDIHLRTYVKDCDDDILRTSRTNDIPPAGRYVVLEVSDSGPGMDETTLQRLFDPFFTTKFTGRGLGMAALLGIVGAHKGAILVDSTLGQGSVVRVLFPAITDAVSPKTSPAPVPPSLGAEVQKSSSTILVVDDDEIVRRACKRMLTKQGWQVLEAADGPQALEICRQSASEITCVILDLTMPSMSGAEVFRAMRKIRTDMRVILTSGYSEDEGPAGQLTKEGLAGFIQKPFSSQSLLGALSHALQV